MAVVTEKRKSSLTFRMDKVNGEIIIQVWKSEQICEQNITEVKKKIIITFQIREKYYCEKRLIGSDYWHS